MRRGQQGRVAAQLVEDQAVDEREQGRRGPRPRVITRFRCDETPAGQLEHQLRLLADAGRVPPFGALTALNVEWDLTVELAGLPGRLQRPLWRAAAAVSRRRR